MNLAEFNYQDLLNKVDELCQYLKENGVNSNQIIAIYGKYSFDNIALFIQNTPSFLNLLLISKKYQNYDLSPLRLITYGPE